MFRAFLKTMVNVGPLHIVWLIYSCVGSLTFAFFSIPSSGYSMALIPMFTIAGLTLLWSSFLCYKDRDLFMSRKIGMYGMWLLTVTSWLRGVALWGVDQEGAGSSILASVVWSWLSVGFAMMFVSMFVRGVRYH